MKYLIVIFLFLVGIADASSQGHDWWAQNTGWDGSSNFSKYLILKPAWMGPNAFYIPSKLNGVVDTNLTVENEMQTHFAKGEVTINPYIKVNIPFGKWASLEINAAPVEYFETSHEWKTNRKIFHENYNDKWAAGDVRFLFTGKIRSNPDMAVYMGLRTASGTGLGAARNTDSPQYFFNYAIRFGQEKLKWYASSGFTAWQTYEDQHKQNDGLVYNLGAEYRPDNNWLIIPEVNGIVAYRKGGDRPMMVSTRITHQVRKWNFGLNLRTGIFDWPFTTIGLISGYRFG